MTPTHSEDHLPIGARLDDYEIQEILGQGGFGITYKCWDNILSCFVALKEYFPGHIASRDGDSVSIKVTGINAEAYNKGLESFVQEAQTLARFQHPGVVPVKRLIQSNNTAYMVMGFVEGASLAEYRRAQISPRQLLTWTEQLLDALEQVHEAGLLHRDIKPSNVYIDTKERAMLLDFGASRRVVAEASHSITGIISTGYSPPEQYSESTRNQGPWSDLYSLSATLYRCITGHKPAEAPIRLDSKVDGDPDPLRLLSPREYPQFPAGLLDAVCKGLALSRTGRPQSVDAFRRLLQSGAPVAGKIEPAEVTEATEAAATQRRAESKTEVLKPTQPLTSRTGKRRPLILASLLAAVAVVGVAVGVLGWPLIQEYTRWQAVQCDDAELLRGYLAAYPDGRYEADAKTCLAAIDVRLAAAEAERQAAEEAEQKRKAEEEAERQAAAETERKRKAKEEAERQAAAEAERKRKAEEEAERQAAAEAEQKRKAEEEAERQAAAEAERKRKAKEEAERQAATEAERQERAHWAGVECSDERSVRGYLEAYPEGRHKTDATACLAAIELRFEKECNLAQWNTNDFFKTTTAGQVRGCLNAGADINVQNKNGEGETPLHYAARHNENPDVINILLKAGADINARNDNDVTPLHYAAYNDENPDVINTLLNAGADINARDGYGGTPLHHAAYNNENPDVINALLNAGTNINARNNNDATPLHYAAANNNPDVINILLNAGADINARNKDGETPWYVARENNSIQGTEAYRRLKP